MAVTTYRWDDASAPTLTGQAGSLIALLDACLVNGYGSKGAAGWTKPYTGTSLAAFRAGGGSMAYLDVVDTSTTATQLRGYMAMTALGTGTDPFPTVAQMSFGNYYYKSAAGTTARPWVLIADNKRFYLFSVADLTTAEGMQASSNLNTVHGLFFGDIVSYLPSDAYPAALISSNAASSTASDFGGLDASINAALDSHFLARDYTQTGTALQFTKVAGGRGSMTIIGNSGGAYPSPVHGGIDLEPILVGEPTSRVTRGHLPGLWNPAHIRPGVPMDTFTGKTGTPLAGMSFLILPVCSGTAGHVCVEISDTWG